MQVMIRPLPLVPVLPVQREKWTASSSSETLKTENRTDDDDQPPALASKQIPETPRLKAWRDARIKARIPPGVKNPRGYFRHCQENFNIAQEDEDFLVEEARKYSGGTNISETSAEYAIRITAGSVKRVLERQNPPVAGLIPASTSDADVFLHQLAMKHITAPHKSRAQERHERTMAAIHASAQWPPGYGKTRGLGPRPQFRAPARPLSKPVPIFPWNRAQFPWNGVHSFQIFVLSGVAGS